jgi:predicted DNA-binding transcriptional regulator YafY
MSPDKSVEIIYTNWRGIMAPRRIVPLRVEFENSEWHPDTQWVLYAIDLDKGEERAFAMKDIESWRPLADEKEPQP